MGKKEEEDIIRIAKKMDKMAQKKNGVRALGENKRFALPEASRRGSRERTAKLGANGTVMELAADGLI